MSFREHQGIESFFLVIHKITTNVFGGTQILLCQGVCMNRVLSILAAALCLAANVGAATVPNHQQPQVKPSAIPMAAKAVKTAPKSQKSAKAGVLDFLHDACCTRGRA